VKKPETPRLTIMAENKLDRNTYLSRNVGDFPDEMVVNGRKFIKVNDLRYGTNPHQPAAYYKEADAASVIGDMKVLKDGKSGLSQTNLEDISYALNIVKFFDRPACAVMKHVNPSGAAVQADDEPLVEVYRKGRDADNRAVLDNKNDGRNHMGRGGGIGMDLQAQNHPVTIRNTTIAGNAAGETGSPEGLSKGGAIFTTGDSKSKLSMLNCLVAGNTTAGTNVTMSLQYAGDVDHCLFDVADDKIGEHSKVGDPKFVKPARGNYHLSSGSPALGVSAWYEGIPEDLDGIRRRRKPAVGCYEIKAGTLLILR